MTSTEVAVIVFLRCPKPGQVKSRLARRIGADNACSVYEECAKRVLRRMHGIRGRARCFVFYSVAEEKEEVGNWLGTIGCSTLIEDMCAQKQSDNLGDRIIDAFRVVREKAIDAVLHASEETKRNAAVLGPSLDGGFYTMIVDCRGMSIQEGALDGIPWSTDAVLGETSQALGRAGYLVMSSEDAGIPSLRDIDEFEDLCEWYRGANTWSGEDALRDVASNIISDFA
ncbi:hypothetical protein M9435_000126 [Picochlorum sp. BPE23]|nr:hypothetical protein M9435_000126 [Picochlorum sp. BPE23]